MWVYGLRALWCLGLWHPMLVQIIPFYVPICHPSPPPLPAVTYLNRIIKSRRGGRRSKPASPHPGSLRCCWRKSLFEWVGFSEAFNPRGICISPVYPPTPTTLLPPSPPSLRETHRARGERGPSAEWRVKASHVPSSSRFSPRSGQCNEFPSNPPLH